MGGWSGNHRRAEIEATANDCLQKQSPSVTDSILPPNCPRRYGTIVKYRAKNYADLQRLAFDITKAVKKDNKNIPPCWCAVEEGAARREITNAMDAATACSISIGAIKMEMRCLVATDPAFSDPSLFEKPTVVVVEGSGEGFRTNLLNLGPDQTPAVGTRCCNQSLFRGSRAKFHRPWCEHMGTRYRRRVPRRTQGLGRIRFQTCWNLAPTLGHEEGPRWMVHKGGSGPRDGHGRVGGWVSVRALLDRLDPSHGLSNKIHAYFAL